MTLILAGDISSYLCDEYFLFLKDCAKKYEHVVVVTGNHEYYNFSDWKTPSSIHEIDNFIESSVADTPNLHFLQKKSVVIEGVRILGCTLWSHIPEEKQEHVEDMMNDYEYILDPEITVTPAYLTSIHADHVAWLEAELSADRDVPTIVVTHHCATEKLIHSKYKTEQFVALNCAFATDLEHLQSDNIKLWVCGHTHTSMRATVGATQYIAQPFGYTIRGKQENEDFKVEEVEM